MRIVDLTTPITGNHARWGTDITRNGDTRAGDLFQVTTVRLSCHAFTHVDARRHFFGDGATIEATPLDTVVGPAKVVDLKDTVANHAIDADHLAHRMRHVESGDRIILATAWHRHRDIADLSYWRDAPYLTRDAAEHLLARGLQTVCFDFPQDYTIRQMIDGQTPPIEEHVTHDTLLRAGVHMVEYLTNTSALSGRDVFLSAAPLKIEDADGAPARVYAIEDFKG